MTNKRDRFFAEHHRNAFTPPNPKTLDAAFEQIGAEFERRRAIRRRELKRSAWAGFIACAVFALGADLGTWPGRAAAALAVVAAVSAIAAARRLRRT